MRRPEKTNRFWTLLLACGSLIAAEQGHAQTAPASPSAGTGDVTVIGRRMPAAEAPRSTTCEALVRDPFFRAQMEAAASRGVLGPAIYVPTRRPRNPDYGAPPSVPVGSALPSLSKSRFGVRDPVYGGSAPATATPEGGEVPADGAAVASVDQSSIDSAIAACRTAYSRGGGTPNAGRGLPSGIGEAFSGPAAGSAGYIDGRATIARNDTTLPMAFALFDQGRYGEALEWFRKAFAKLQFREGGDEAALFIGKIYLQGLGEKSDPIEAIKWLKKAATAPFDPTMETPVFDPREPERNTAVGEAAVILANLYRTGFKGIPKDGMEARKWLERAYDVGHVPAAKMLGDYYYYGIDGPRDAKKAVSYYRKAAELNLPAAQFALAEILYHGDDGVPQDKKVALGWYQAAATLDHGGALYALGEAYESGDGVAADPQRAIGFYKTAALHGNAAAMVALGLCFHEGKIVSRDLPVARGWFEQGAARSDPDGMFNLAAMLANGEGGQKDVVTAWVWLKQASLLRHETATRALAVLEGRMTETERRAGAAILARR